MFGLVRQRELDAVRQATRQNVSNIVSHYEAELRLARHDAATAEAAYWKLLDDYEALQERLVAGH